MSKPTPVRPAAKPAKKSAKTASTSKSSAAKSAAAKGAAAAAGKDAPNNFPKLHNAMWPGLVGKGSPGAEPFIDFDTMLNLTAKAEVNGVRFDGIDLFLSDPHTSIDSSDDDIKRLADKISSKNLKVGSMVAPVWGGTGGGS